MSNDKSKSQFQDAVDFTVSTLGKDLMGLVLQEIRALPDVWQKLNENRQNEVIDRIRANVETATQKAVTLIASQGCWRVLGELEKITLSDKKQAVVLISSGNDPDALIELYENVREPVMIVLSSAEQFLGGLDEIKGEKDQRDFFPGDDNGSSSGSNIKRLR